MIYSKSAILDTCRSKGGSSRVEVPLNPKGLCIGRVIGHVTTSPYPPCARRSFLSLSYRWAVLTNHVTLDRANRQNTAQRFPFSQAGTVSGKTKKQMSTSPPHTSTPQRKIVTGNANLCANHHPLITSNSPPSPQTGPRTAIDINSPLSIVLVSTFCRLHSSYAWPLTTRRSNCYTIHHQT